MAEVARSSKTSVESTLLQAVKTLNAKMKSLYKKKSTTQGYSVVEASANELDKGKVLTHEDLQLLSENFSPDNYMGRTHFGHLYKGNIPENWEEKRSGEVTIKMWTNEQFLDKDCIIPHDPDLIRHSMEQEIKFLQQPDIAMHPYTVNVMGYCLDDNRLGVVYDLKPLHTLKNYIDNFAEKFGWLKRVNVAVKLAYLLKFFHEHEPEYIVRNLSPAHVMLDQDLNPFLIDYAMIHGGSFVDLLTRQQGGPYGSKGYVSLNELMIGSPTKRSDIHAYGVILLEIIRQCTYTNNRESKLKNICTGDFAWRDYVHYKEMLEEKSDGIDAAAEKVYSYSSAWKDYFRYKEREVEKSDGSAAAEDNLYSFAHESMKNDLDYDARDGNKISILGFRCVEKLMPPIRSMGQLLKELKELKVVQSHPELLLLDDED